MMMMVMMMKMNERMKMMFWKNSVSLSLLSKKKAALFGLFFSLLLLFIPLACEKYKILSSLATQHFLLSCFLYHVLIIKRTHLKRERERERSTCVKKEEEFCLWRIRVVFPRRRLKKKNTKLCVYNTIKGWRSFSSVAWTGAKKWRRIYEFVYRRSATSL